MEIFSAYCGTGKTTACKEYSYCTEIECWKYRDSSEFPKNIVKDILTVIQQNKVLFISTNKIVLDALQKFHIEPTLIYPQRNLKDKYIKRYINRDDHKDFIEVMERYWEGWITELEQRNNKKFVLEKGQYILNHPELKTIIQNVGYE